MRDIYELIRQRETQIENLDKEISRIEKELEALRLTAKLLEETTAVTHSTAAASDSSIAREVAVQHTAPATQPSMAAGSTSTAGAWASAKQFP